MVVAPKNIHLFSGIVVLVYVLMILKPVPLLKQTKIIHSPWLTPKRSMLAICLKTGIETSIERIPVQLLTFLKNEQPLVISDFKETIGTVKVVNILPNIKQRITYPTNRHVESIASDEQKPNERNEGWKLDAWKNYPGFQLLLKDNPDSKWFIMIDDDTYLFKNNLMAHLNTLDHTEPTYIGAANNFRGCDGVIKMGEGPFFAHGGSGIVLSKAAIEKLADNVDDCEVKYEGCWAGDIRTSLCLRDQGILFNRDKATMNFHGNPIQKQKFVGPCSTPFTFHHLFPFQIQLLHNLEVKVQEEVGKDALVTMGQVFKYILENDAVLKSTFNDRIPIKITDKNDIEHEFTYRKGIDFKGADYNHFESTIEECILKCFEDVNCVSWTYTEDTKTCWKKNGVPMHSQIPSSSSGWFDEKFKCDL